MAMAQPVNVSVEAAQEYQVQEITYDGQEIYSQPLSMTENLIKLAQKIDFSKLDEDSQDLPETVGDLGTDEDKKELATFQPSLWPWDSVRCRLKNALTEISVLVDVLNITKEKRYMVMDPVQHDPPEPKPIAVMLAKKKALAAAASIILNGAARLRASQAEANRNQVVPDFHQELLAMRQNWRLKKVGNTIIGDLSYKSAGSRFWQSGMFEVTKSEQALATGPSQHQVPMPLRPSALKVILPSELEGISYIQVTIQKDTEVIASGELTFSLPQSAFAQAEADWQQKLEAAQNILFCRELFSQLAREAVQLQPAIPNLVVGNQITTSLFPGVQLCIGLCHCTAEEKNKHGPPPQRLDQKHVLEHSLHQLLQELQYNALHHSMPHPTTAVLGVTKRRRLAGPEAYDRRTLSNMTKSDTLLEHVIRQTQHMVLRLRTVYVIDTYACEIKDPLIIAHWICLNSPTQSSVKINIITSGYETICRTPLVIHMTERNLKAICRDGRVMRLSYEPQELRYLLMCQVSQHQVNAVQALAKLMGWKVLSTSYHAGLGSVEPVGNASSVLMASPTGDRVISVRCGPQTGVHVSVSSSPQQQDFYPSTLVRDRKWQNLGGSFRDILWEKMEGRNFLNKMEHLMASLTAC